MRIQKRHVATEWDGAWFCDKCFKMEHYTVKAYIVHNEKLCEKCFEKIQKPIDKQKIK